MLCPMCGALSRTVRYRLCSVQCVLHSIVHCVLHPAVHCLPYSVLAVHAHFRGAVHYALGTVLLVHPGAVPCLRFPVPLHPPA